MEKVPLSVPWSESKQMNARAKAFVFLFLFSAPAAWAAEPTSVREFSERCAASYASVFEVPVELVEAVIQVESGWNP
jgi:soluble lytic murein transglycosylase-like protein